MTLTSVTWLNLCLVTAGVYVVKQLFTKKNPAPYPPGPQRLPIIGNILDMPRLKPWLTFTEWGKNYGKYLTSCPIHIFQCPVAGGISHVEVLGQHMIVLNSSKTAIEMLDKKSFVYSDRPVLPMGGELVGWKNALVLLPYGDRLREYRKNFHRVIGSRAALSIYHPTLEIETHRFLKRVLAEPDQLQSHVRQYAFIYLYVGLVLNVYSTAGAIILRISHGYEVKENNDPFVDLADRATYQFSCSTATGAFMVDVIPSRKSVVFQCFPQIT
jgi:hypothetical protein